MKIKSHISKNIIPAWGFALGLAIAGWFPNTTIGAERMKDGQHLMKQIRTTAEAEALKPGDQMVMVCAKCKSVMIHNVTTEKGHVKVMTAGEKHLCTGCDSTIEVVGVGKGKHDVVKHVCKMCGEDSVFCCATKPGSGSTKGMEKN